MAELPTQFDIIREFFLNNPNRDIKHPEVVDWAVREYQQRTGNVFRDPDRAIRSLHQQGWLIKVRKGVYRYDPDAVVERQLEDFTASQKQQILERDDYKCVICGRGPKDGVELQVDHIMPKDKGGQAIIDNGQTLCADHNFRKKNYSQTETGKKFFMRLLKLARKNKDSKIIAFCEDILRVYDVHGINDHIDWQ